jgi:membrane glycosyltransferase
MLERPTRSADVMPASAPSLAGRQALFFSLVAVTILGMVWLCAVALSVGRFGALDAALVALFAVTLPWTVISFWNATIGLIIMRFARDPVAAVTPAAGRVRGDEPITASTAILACIRNEPPARVIRWLTPMLEGLAALGVGERFHLYVLSDTGDETIAAAEAERFAALAKAWRGRLPIDYRRRERNAGFKAGNIRDFCNRWGAEHDFALMLDADSVMTADAVLRLVRIMQIEPRLGILQSLVIGMPSMSAFARLFQFGMRLSMRSYTIGSAWWQGDCGPYWGHNALVRLAPFMAHCDLPVLPGSALVSGHVLSHDQIEAVLMRRAGYEVRVLAEEGQSFEQNPPTLIEFLRRDMRWCQGNMQYWHFLVMPGLRPVSRYQLAFAMLMFLDSPAWMGLLVLGTMAVAAAGSSDAFIRPDAGFALLVTVLVMWFAPNIATAIDVLARPKLRGAFGGGVRFTLSALAQTAFVLLLLPIMWFGHTLFLIRLLLGRSIGWTAQARDDHQVPLRLAAQQLWPETLAGAGAIALLGVSVPSAIPYALFIAGGLLLAIPFAVLTAEPALGRALVGIGFCRLPEELAPPPELAALALPAIEISRAASERRLSLRERIRMLLGVIRSLRIYYSNANRRAAMLRLYGAFVKPGDLVFDLGAHVGDRTAVFRRLGARVIAIEPQPALANVLRLIHGRDRAVAIEPIAVGRRAGTIALKLNLANPTVSTASEAFVRAADGACGWEGQSWTGAVEVPLATLDTLIARHGLPAFIKIDVEGFEAEVLAGLTLPVPALSFEFTTIQREVAADCIARCRTLGFARFNAALGESQALAHATWQSPEEIAAWLAALPDEANSGDIYAVQESEVRSNQKSEDHLI